MITATEADAQKVEIDPDGNEAVSPEIVHELDGIFSAGVPDTAALASLLLKLTGRAVVNLRKRDHAQ